jgi:hypothetical protein
MSILAAGIDGAHRHLAAVEQHRAAFAESVGRLQAAYELAITDPNISPVARREFVIDRTRLNNAWQAWGDVQ